MTKEANKQARKQAKNSRSPPCANTWLCLVVPCTQTWPGASWGGPRAWGRFARSRRQSTACRGAPGRLFLRPPWRARARRGYAQGQGRWTHVRQRKKKRGREREKERESVRESERKIAVYQVRKRKRCDQVISRERKKAEEVLPTSNTCPTCTHIGIIVIFRILNAMPKHTRLPWQLRGAGALGRGACQWWCAPRGPPPWPVPFWGKKKKGRGKNEKKEFKIFSCMARKGRSRR